MPFPVVGTELEAVTSNTSTDFTQVANSYDTATSRGAMRLGGTDEIYWDIDADQAEVWFHAAIWIANTGSLADDPFIKFYDATALQEVFRVDGTNGDLVAQYWNGAGFTTVNTGIPLSQQTLEHFDIQCKIDGVDGSFAIYRDGTELWSLTGDTDFDGNLIDRVILRSIDTNIFTYFSECIIDVADTRGQRLITLGIDGDGTETDWTGDYTDIDEIGEVDDADFIESATAGQTSTFTCENVDASFSDWDVLAVILASTAAETGAAPNNMRHAVRTGGANYFGSNLSGLSGALTTGYQTIWEDNPDTTNPWTISELDSLEIGVDSVT